MTFYYHGCILRAQRYIEVIPIRRRLPDEDYSKADAFIRKLRPMLRTGEFQIEQTEKNRCFDRRFSLTHEKKRDILKSLTADDCYQIELNNNPRYEAGDVYKFFKEVTLEVFGEAECVKLYLKMYVRETKTYDMVIVISFHEEGMHEV